MANLQLTAASTGNKFVLAEDDIIWILTDTLGAKVVWRSEIDGQILEEVVSESPAAIAYNSDTFIQVTTTDAQTPYISYTRMGTIDPTGTYVTFRYDAEGATRAKISVTTTYAALLVLLYQKKGDLVLPFTAVSATLDTITLQSSTNYASKFGSGVIFEVFGSSTAAMNTMWTAASAAHSGVTTITVTGQIPVGASETGYVRLRVV